MQKSKLGISVALFAAALYLSAFFGGYIATFLLAGYVLLVEENPWLKRCAIKAAALMIFFSLLYAFVGVIPDIINLINDLIRIFSSETNFSIPVITKIFTFITNTLHLCELVLFVGLTFMSLGQKTIHIPVIDDLISKHTN